LRWRDGDTGETVIMEEICKIENVLNNMDTANGNKNVWNTGKIMDELSQHDKLRIVISSSDPTYSLPKHQYEKFNTPHRGDAYFFMFFEKGVTDHRVDWQTVRIVDGQLLFIMPNQVHASPPLKKGLKFHTLSFARNLLSLIPQQLPFLINPFNTPKITFDDTAGKRVSRLFEMLNQLLHDDHIKNDTGLILAYLNSLLTEFNTAYFNGLNPGGTDAEDISIFIQFKIRVENEFTSQPPVAAVAAKMLITENKLYKIVKHYSGFSPKEYLIQRLILEAQRIIFYDKPAAKELAYELGFSDPDYFSRLFKKKTGKSISQFVDEVEDLSRKKRN
jgi:AraC family transcriptional activator of pobA